MKKLTLVLDSSQLSSYDECNRRWNYSSNMLIVPAQVDRKVVMDQGTLGHLYLEKYYESIINGRTKTQAMQDMFTLDVDNIVCAVCKNRVGQCKGTEHEFKPLPNTLTKAERMVVREKLELYCYTYIAKEDIIPQTSEIGFSERIYEDDENLFVLEGRIDLLAKYAGSDIVVDHKFQERK